MRKSRDPIQGRGKRAPSEAVPVARKSFRQREESERQTPDVDFTRNTWSVRTASKWAGVPQRTLYTLLKAGKLPCIAMGDMQVQEMAAAKNGRRVRRCYRFVIPARAFVKAWEGFTSAETVTTVGNTAA
jgi:hypothetical protein